jgi:hypothetical protein
MQVLKTIRDHILIALNLPTPDQYQAWRELAERTVHEHDRLKRYLNEKHERPWKITKDGTKRYRKVCVRVIKEKWITESQSLLR